MMNQTVIIDEEFVEDNIREEELLKNGKKHKEQKIKKDYLEKATYIDIVINALIAVVTGILLYKKSFGEDFVIVTFFVLIMLVVPSMTIVWEIIYLVKNRKGKNAPIAYAMTISSLCLKIVSMVIALVCGIGLTVQLLFG